MLIRFECLIVVYCLIGVTNLYRLFSLPIGLDVGFSSAVYLMIGCLLLLYKLNDMLAISKNKYIFSLIVAFFIMPLFAHIVHFSLGGLSFGSSIRWSLINFQNILILVFSAYLCFSNKKWFVLVVKLGLSVSFIGIIWHSFDQGFFRELAKLSNVSSAYVEFGSSIERLFGFYVDQNRAGLSLFLLFLVFALSKTYSTKEFYGFSVLAISAIALTGSRTAFLLMMLFLFYHFLFSHPVIKNRDLVIRIIKFFLAMVLIGLVLSYLLPILTILGLDNLQNRLGPLIQGEFNSYVSNDDSLAARSEAQVKYLAEIAKSPIIGWGPEAARILLETGVFKKPSHNMYLESAFSYGLPYVIFLIYIAAYYALACLRHNRNGCYAVVSLLAFTMLYALMINTLFLNKTYFLLLAFLIAQRWWKNEENTACN